ncbi:MAG: hypothetical protein H6739_14085 [Alphaproteobacteria bacterium]|nr:hypothetical protein [Alphaproteobacteria bacterium]
MSARIITVYAFRGGVGSTLMALALAARFAEAGQRVLLLDANLNSPGLTLMRPLQDLVEDRDGLLEWLLPALEDSAPLPEPVAVDLAALDLKPQLRDSCLHFIGAARLDARYGERLDRVQTHLAALDPDSLARRFRALGDALRGADGGRYDLVVIDTSAGIYGLSLRLLTGSTDVAVLLSGLNDQHIRGLSSTLSTLDHTPDGGPDRVLAISPVPEGELELKARRREVLRARLGQVADVEIPYHPRLALEDNARELLALRPLHAAHDELIGLLRVRLGWTTERLSDALARHLRQEEPEAATHAFQRLYVLSRDAACSRLFDAKSSTVPLSQCMVYLRALEGLERPRFEDLELAANLALHRLRWSRPSPHAAQIRRAHEALLGRLEPDTPDWKRVWMITNTAHACLHEARWSEEQGGDATAPTTRARALLEQTLGDAGKLAGVARRCADAWGDLAALASDLSLLPHAQADLARVRSLKPEVASKAGSYVFARFARIPGAPRALWAEVERYADESMALTPAGAAYDKAVALAQLGRAAEAWRWLDRAFELRPDYRDQALADADLSPLHDLPGWQARFAPPSSQGRA